MAFDGTKFTRVGPQNDNAPTIWSYTTADASTTVDGSGYFNDVADRVKVGDMIYGYSSADSKGGIYLVTSNTRDLTASPPVSGVVDVANALAVGSINSD